MTVLQLDSTIDKWEQTSNNYTGNTLDGEKQSFLVYPHHPELKTLFKVCGHIYITDPDTDFILDVDITSVMQLDIDGIKPVPKDLYDAYLKARTEWNFKIEKEATIRGIAIWRQGPPPPYEKLKDCLIETINQAYKDN